MTYPIEFNLDSTALGSSACILDLVRTVIGELPNPAVVSSTESVGAYRERAMNIELVYGIAVHGFIDTMYKTGGHYPTAKMVAEKLLLLPNNPNKKKLWMNDPKHLIATCYNVWSQYVEEELTFEVLSVRQNCWWCKGEGSIRDKSLDNNICAPTICKHCKGLKTVEGPATEITFSIPYYEDKWIKVNLCGTIDTVGKFKNGCYAIRDWKTTGSWDTDTYFEQYELSRQLRLYRLACKLMTENYPNSVLGQVGATHMGAFIDGIFLDANANDVKCNRSDVFQYTSKQIDDFRRTLDDRILDISKAVETNYLPKQGILNGACEASPDGIRKFSKCRFWHVCKSNDNVASVLLNRDFKRQHFNPLKYNEG